MGKVLGISPSKTIDNSKSKVMKRKTILLYLVIMSANLVAQDKPVIDTGMLNIWPYIVPAEQYIALSRNGHYIAYVIRRQPLNNNTLVIQDLRSNWKKTIIGRDPQIVLFSADGKQLCWRQDDSVWLQATGREEGRLLGVAKTCSFSPEKIG
jgi:hypothetical protein